jgi:hypothetical protein
MGGIGPSRANKFLYAPAPPPPSVWALKPLSWALVHKTTYAPMIYTAFCIMFWMRAYPLRGQVGEGLALEFESFLGLVKRHQADRRVPFEAQKTRSVLMLEIGILKFYHGYSSCRAFPLNS